MMIVWLSQWHLWLAIDCHYISAWHGWRMYFDTWEWNTMSCFCFFVFPCLIFQFWVWADWAFAPVETFSWRMCSQEIISAEVAQLNIYNLLPENALYADVYVWVLLVWFIIISYGETSRSLVIFIVPVASVSLVRIVSTMKWWIHTCLLLSRHFSMCRSRLLPTATRRRSMKQIWRRKSRNFR